MAHTPARDTLDTNLIVHYILRDIPRQFRKVQKLLESGDVHYVPDLAITEAAYVFVKHYNRNPEDVAYILQRFLEHHDDVLEYNRELFELAFQLWASHPALSFNDCCMAAYAELNHAEPLFTFDRKLAAQSPSAKRLV